MVDFSNPHNSGLIPFFPKHTSTSSPNTNLRWQNIMAISNILLSQGWVQLTLDPYQKTLTPQEWVVNFRPTNTCLFLTAYNTQREGCVWDWVITLKHTQNVDLLILSVGRIWTVTSVWVLISSELVNEKQTRIRLIFTGCCLVIRVLVYISRPVGGKQGQRHTDVLLCLTLTVF